MRICIVGDYSQNLDEGLKNIAFHLSEGLSRHNAVLRTNVKKLFAPSCWKDIENFAPQIVHYIPGPTTRSFLVVKVLGAWTRAKTVVSAPHPVFSVTWRGLLPLLKPDIVLAHSHKSAEMFQALGCNVALLPNGVDVKRFKPVGSDEKQRLRDKYGIRKDKFVMLHVGHIKKQRNLGVLRHIQGADTQVVIVASGYLGTDRQLYAELERSGCLILNGYLKNVEEIYALSDCYVFPVRKGDSILCPLSVMEAMACNLPVISSSFDGLTSLFQHGDGLDLVEEEIDFPGEVEHLKRNPAQIRTREKVLPYSWENVVERLEAIYAKLIRKVNDELHNCIN